MGRVTVPHGVKGWVKIYTLTAELDSLCDYPVWRLGRDGGWREVRIIACRVQGSTLVAQFEGVDDRDAAAALRGAEVAVLRAEMPAAEDGEFYWTDLIGLKVVNKERYDFGRVSRVLQTGANDVLVVAGAKGGTESLIPFIAGVISRVDVVAGEIEVDWGEDY
jgi:16S rRNA processing protein RimM